MNKFVLVPVILCALTSLNVNAAKNTEVFEYQKATKLGMQALETQNYEKAFKHLEIASKLGNKDAQYSLALLYMEGHGTTQDYAQAYLWLNVASEVNEKKWRKLRDKIHNALSEEQKNRLHPFVESYINKYGAKAQEVSCEKKSPTGTHRRIMLCTKNLDIGSTRL